MPCTLSALGVVMMSEHGLPVKQRTIFANLSGLMSGIWKGVMVWLVEAPPDEIDGNAAYLDKQFK